MWFGEQEGSSCNTSWRTQIHFIPQTLKQVWCHIVRPSDFLTISLQLIIQPPWTSLSWANVFTPVVCECLNPSPHLISLGSGAEFRGTTTSQHLLLTGQVEWRAGGGQQLSLATENLVFVWKDKVLPWEKEQWDSSAAKLWYQGVKSRLIVCVGGAQSQRLGVMLRVCYVNDGSVWVRVCVCVCLCTLGLEVRHSTKDWGGTSCQWRLLAGNVKLVVRWVPI